MDPVVARAVIEAGRAAGSRLTAQQATVVVDGWLRARGLVADRWGNYVLPSGRRYHFDAKTVRVQKKSMGEWRDTDARPVIEAATDLLVNAAIALQDTTEEARWKAVEKARAKQKVKRADQAEFDRLQARARDTARKRVADELRDDVRGYFLQGNRYPHAARINEALARHLPAYVERLRQGGTLPGDALFASIDRPPMLVLYSKAVYDWTETVDGITYSVLLRHAEPGLFAGDQYRAGVQIGRGLSAMGLTFDPFSLSVTTDLMREGEPQGDGLLVGRVWDDGEVLGATLVEVMAHEKRKGAGRRLLGLWCRMMIGYGIRTWAAEGLGEEGVAFLRAMQDQGLVRVMGVDGGTAFLQCPQADPG
jgi:hypothetical protein